MDIKNFVLSYYKNSLDTFHIQKVEEATEAKKPHSHEYFQIYYVQKGRVTHFIENNRSELSHGDMFIVPPDCIHYINTQKDTVFYSFSFMPDFIKEFNALSTLLLKTKKDALRPKISLNSYDVVYVETIIERMYKEFLLRPLGFADNIRLSASLLLTILARYYIEKETSSVVFENNKDFVLHCVEYIKTNFSEQITLEEMTKRSMMTKSSFCRIFLDVTGYTFKDYLNRCRIEKSAQLIKNGHKISAAAVICGYSDFSTFYRNFVKIMGVSPSNYKSGL